MEAIYTCCAGLDVHKQTVDCVVRRAQPDGSVQVQVRQFGTMTDDLLEMVEWLKGKGVTRVAMESTGVFWKPIFNLLEGHFTVLLVNARHVGEQDAGKLAERARGKLRGKIPELRRAPRGRLNEHHRFELRLHWDHLEQLEKLIGRLSMRIAELCKPYRKQIEQLDRIAA